MANNAEFISIKVDLDNAMQLFENLEKESPKIRKRLLSGIGTKVKGKVKKGYRATLDKGSGKLYKSIKRRVVRSGKAVIIDAKARAKNNVFYGYALAEGSTIKAKNEKTLTFQIDGKWIRKKEVKLPVKDYIISPSDRYLGSTEYRSDLDKLIQREVDKLEKKGIAVKR